MSGFIDIRFCCCWRTEHIGVGVIRGLNAKKKIFTGWSKKNPHHHSPPKLGHHPFCFVARAQRAMTAHVHMHMTWGGADQTDLRWGQPVFVPLDAIEASSFLGPLVKFYLTNAASSTFWSIRLDVGAATGQFPPAEDTRTIIYGVKYPADEAIIEDHLDLLGHAIPMEQMATTDIRVVGSIILHTEM